MAYGKGTKMYQGNEAQLVAFFFQTHRFRSYESFPVPSWNEQEFFLTSLVPLFF